MVTAPWLAWRAVVAPLGVALVALAIVLPTVAPGVGFWDTAESQTAPPLLGTMHPTGFPAYVVLGWIASIILVPLGEPAFRMNVLSAVLVATSAGLTVLLVRRLTGSSPIAAAAGVGLALTPIAWRIGTHADGHALHLALFALLLLVLVEWRQRHVDGDPRSGRWLVASAAAIGVAMANHSLTLLLPPAIAAYVLVVDPGILRRPRLVLACAGVLAAVAVLLYAELPLRAGPFRAPLVYGRPETWEGFWYVVLAEQFRGSLVNPFSDPGGKLGELADLAAAQFGILALLIPVGFLATVRRAPHYALLTGVAVVVTAFFAASYDNADIGRYYLGPALIAWSWLAVLAIAGVEAMMRLAGPPPGESPDARGAGGSPTDRTRNAVTHPPRQATATHATVATLIAVALLVPTLGALPVRATRVDASDDRVAEHWLDAALGAMEPNAVVVSWWSYSTTLWYAQHIEGRFPDGFVVDDRTRLDLQLGEVSDVIDEYLGSRPVYVIRADQAELTALRLRYDLESVPGATMLYRVVAELGARR